tara:strand:- start:4267 stop:4563 length:297 start_codon:yes stop_codon:yes gene_type:complete
MAKAKAKAKTAPKKAPKKEAKKAPNKIYPPHVVPASEVVGDTIVEPDDTMSKKELSQEALDALSTAKPSVGAGGTVLRVLAESSYAKVESSLTRIINS